MANQGSFSKDAITRILLHTKLRSLGVKAALGKRDYTDLFDHLITDFTDDRVPKVTATYV